MSAPALALGAGIPTRLDSRIDECPYGKFAAADYLYQRRSAGPLGFRPRQRARRASEAIMVMGGGPLHLGGPEEFELGQLHKHWGLVLAIGVGMILLGTFFLIVPLIPTLLTLKFLGILLLIAAVMQLINAVTARQWRGFVLHLLAGLVQLIVGGFFLEETVLAAEVLTMVLAAGFIISGLFRMVMALTGDFTGRIWVLLNGFVTLILGLMIWRRLPDSGLWVIGLFLGIDTVLCGWTWVTFALQLSKRPPQESPLSGRSSGPSDTAFRA
jgi:uncharacterized membrane protein HdeD (DUF308 family)